MKLRGCVNKLNQVQRHVITMRMLEEMTGAEVARELSLTPGHVAVLLHRAKAELQRCVMS
ncbi:RNA polymerase sigma factor [Archangium violaceum]|uniref:RNA polymerase sigma factor n=1 Tax=Archangium violaceum TaxID=83451 RepID=UPI0037C0FB3E